MWQHLIIGVLVGLAALYLLRLIRRALSGQTACEQGLCEGCRSAAECRRPPEEACPLSAEETPPEVTADRPRED